MVNYLDKLKFIYDKEIRNSCESNRQILIKCLEENFNDEFVCKIEQDVFNLCVKTYNEEFKKKYLKITNFRIEE